jgi:hypothetical protein
MDLPTYTNIWRIEKRLYKLYDFRLPMPVPIGQVAVFALIVVPYGLVLALLRVPFSHTLFWLYVLPPGVLTWLATRPVLEGKRLPELLTSRLRYLGEPRTWCRLAPLGEPAEVTVVCRVWRQAAAASGRAVDPAEAPVAALVAGEPASGSLAVAAEASAEPGALDGPASAGAGAAVTAGGAVDGAAVTAGAAADGAGETAGAAADRGAGTAGAAADGAGVTAGAAADRGAGTAGAAADRGAGTAGAAADGAAGTAGAAADRAGVTLGAADPGGRVRTQAADPGGPVRTRAAAPDGPGADVAAAGARPPNRPAWPAAPARARPAEGGRSAWEAGRAAAGSGPAERRGAPALERGPDTPEQTGQRGPNRDEPGAAQPPRANPSAARPSAARPEPGAGSAAPASPARGESARGEPVRAPAVTVASHRKDQPPQAVERALGGPAAGHQAAGRPGWWRERVLVVPGGHRPGKPGPRDRDRARAKLALGGRHRVVVLGCTPGAGQTITTLRAAQMLAELRAEPVAALDLKPGRTALTRLARTMPGLAPAGRPDSGLQVISGGEIDPGEAPGRIIDLVAARYPLTLVDPAAACLPGALDAADLLLLVAPVGRGAARALAMTLEWLDANGRAQLAAGAIAVLNGVRGPAGPDLGRAVSVASGRCRAIVQVPWQDDLHPGAAQQARPDSSPAAPRPGAGQPVLTPADAYTALAGLLVGSLAGQTAALGAPV